MRVYLGCTMGTLRAAAASGKLDPQEVRAHAVTPAVREWYTSGNLEELEFSVLTDAAESSLALLAQEPTQPRRRVVLVTEVADEHIHPAGTEERSAVRLEVPVPMSGIESVHVDEAGSADAVAAAAAVWEQAVAGDEDALFAVDEAQAADLLWYDVSEIGALLLEVPDPHG